MWHSWQTLVDCELWEWAVIELSNDQSWQAIQADHDCPDDT